MLSGDKGRGDKGIKRLTHSRKFDSRFRGGTIWVNDLMKFFLLIFSVLNMLFFDFKLICSD